MCLVDPCSDGEEAGPALDRLTQVQQLAAASHNVIIFSGSGGSANCGACMLWAMHAPAAALLVPTKSTALAAHQQQASALPEWVHVRLSCLKGLARRLGLRQDLPVQHHLCAVR